MMICACGDDIHAARDNMPLLSQWIKKFSFNRTRIFWQGHKDSNSGHAVLETAALPAELYPCILFALPLFDSFIILTHLFIFCNTFSKIILHCAKAKIRQLCRRTIFKRIQKPKTLIFAIDKSAKSVKMIIVKGIDGKSRRLCGKKRDGNKG